MANINGELSKFTVALPQSIFTPVPVMMCNDMKPASLIFFTLPNIFVTDAMVVTNQQLLC